MEPIFFTAPEEFRAWLAEHHAEATELLVGFRKVSSGLPSMTWSQSVDEALCYGWIDGVRRSLGAEGYTIRFTPRRAGSTWSLVNVRKVAELTEAGRMQPAGLAAFAARRESDTGVYSFERSEPAVLDEEAERRFRDDARAWAYWETETPSYRRAALHWVTSAKRPETRERRLTTLITDSAAGARIGLFRSAPRRAAHDGAAAAPVADRPPPGAPAE